MFTKTISGKSIVQFHSFIVLKIFLKFISKLIINYFLKILAFLLRKYSKTCSSNLRNESKSNLFLCRSIEFILFKSIRNNLSNGWPKLRMFSTNWSLLNWYSAQIDLFRFLFSIIIFRSLYTLRAYRFHNNKTGRQNAFK